MNEYQRGRTTSGGIKRWFSVAGTGVIVVVLVVIFVIAVFWFRRPKDRVEQRIDSIAEVLRPDPISEAVLKGVLDTESREAKLHLVTSLEEVGEARRGKKDERYFFELKASLPEIDREVFFYQAWLVRPIPYDFISVGELVTDETGVFVLEWEGIEKTDYSGYVDVVITRQEYKGSVDPQAHIVEGEFGK